MGVRVKNIRYRVQIPDKFSSADRIAIGNDILAHIRTRTAGGKDETGSSFPRYSKQYKQSKVFRQGGKSSQVNLKLTGDMLSDLRVLEHGQGFIQYGYESGDSVAGKVDGNVTGSYGDSTGHASKARPFIKISDKELKLILAKYETNNIKPSEQEQIVKAILGEDNEES